MSDVRDIRRISNFLTVQFDRLHLDQVPEPRDPRGKRWALPTLLRSALLGLMTGQKSLADTERVTERLSRHLRGRLEIARRVPDTTLRDTLSALEPKDVRPLIHSAIRSAHRSKSLSLDFGLPFGTLAMDGKYLTVPAVDDRYSQRHSHPEQGAKVTGRIGTMTAVLSSSEARPCVDVYPIPAATNEMATFQVALSALLEVYGHLDLFRLVTYDAGACSKANASFIRDQKLHYLLSLKGSQPELSFWASLWLGQLSQTEADITTVEGAGNRQVTRRIFLRPCSSVPVGWEHLRTLIRVDSDGFDRLGCPTHETFYFLSSLAVDRLSATQWLTVIRRHWAVESSHQTLDTAFEEDDHPWVLQNPRLTLVVAILRRLAYTLLAIFRSVTQRSDGRRNQPWRHLFERISDVLVSATATALEGLRKRRPTPATLTS